MTTCLIGETLPSREILQIEVESWQRPNAKGGELGAAFSIAVSDEVAAKKVRNVPGYLV